MGQSGTTIPGLRALIVDDEDDLGSALAACLQSAGHLTATARSIQSALAEVSHRAFDLIFLRLGAAAPGPADLIPRLLAENPWSQIVVVCPDPSADAVVESMRRGASDVLPCPFTPVQVRLVTEKIAERRRLEARVELLSRALGRDDPELDFLCASGAMREAVDTARRVAASSATLLIRGEMGVGKGRLARAIHTWSGRLAPAFATVCCQCDASALEVELFGLSSYDAPDAPAAQRGRVAFCEAGTLVLREIGRCPLAIQPRLQRFLHDKEYERSNDLTCRQADVRVIATSTADLHDAARHGTFRPDLLLAVDVVTIEIPPLRQRPEDIRLLADLYLDRFARESGRPVKRVSADATDVLLRHSYPGNVRELRNLVERAVLLCDGDCITLDHLPPNLLNGEGYHVGDLVSLEKISDLHIRRVLACTRSYEAAASVLEINSITLWRRRKRYGLTARSPRDAAPRPADRDPAG